MIKLTNLNGTATYDRDLDTFTAQVSYGGFTGEYPTPEDLPLELSETDINELKLAKVTHLVARFEEAGEEVPSELIAEREALIGVL